MLFGNRLQIAIEAVFDTNSADWCFGRVCLWVKGEQIGDFNQTLILTVTVGFFEDFLKYVGQRHDPVLESLPANVLVSTLSNALFGDDAKTLREAAQLGHRFGKFCVCPGGGEAFDGWIAFYAEGQHSSRFVWLNTVNEQAGEIKLAPGEFESNIQAFIDWANDQGCGSAR